MIIKKLLYSHQVKQKNAKLIPGTFFDLPTSTAVIELVSTCHDDIYFQLRWRRAFSAIVRQQRAQKQTSRLAAPSTEDSKPDDTSTTVQQPRRSIIRAATCTHKPQTTNIYAERGLATRTAVHRTKSEGGYKIFFLLFWSHKEVTFKEKRVSVDDSKFIETEGSVIMKTHSHQFLQNEFKISKWPI